MAVKGGRNWNAVKLRPVPLLEGAACRTHPNPDLWFSEQPADRNAARNICRACPELGPCREWALAQPASGDTGIVAGMSPGERDRERRERKQAARLAELRQRSGMAAVNAAKTHCGICGEPLSGPNLMITRDRDGGRKRRVCRNCHRRRVASSRRLARMLARARRTAAA